MLRTKKRGPYKKRVRSVFIDARRQLGEIILEMFALHPTEQYESPKGYRFVKVDKTRSYI